MQATVSSNPLDQYCLDKLQKMLDLAMQTAEAASAEGNHKIVLQVPSVGRSQPHRPL